ncbi:MAG: GyrI-like domain-containing protein [Gammaproteobacteria bacterium]
MRNGDDAVAGVCQGVVQQTMAKTDLLYYCTAIEVNEASTVLQDMAPDEIPGATYATFTHRGEAKNIDRTVSYICSTWLAQSGKQHTYGPDLEIYDSGYDATSADSLMYYAIPVC